ncbi:MAG: iron-containing alcohol dehydrogenase [Chloroflexi bacterium]|nr:iron-containing alcohol dehydrogenase [Chloroflexota bacterium]
MVQLVGEYRFLPMERVLFGQGSLSRLREEVERLGGRRPFLIAGRTLAAQTGLAARVEQALAPDCAGMYAGIQAHAPMEQVIEAAGHAARAEADLLISIGGGAVSDATKVVALMLAQGINDKEGLLDYHREVERTGRAALEDKTIPPQIALPTTLSAGEFTSHGTLLDHEGKVKMRFGHPRLSVKTVILDPELTVATPARLWLSTGVKALDHAIERLYSLDSQLATDAACLKALSLLFEALPQSYQEPLNLDARLRCQVGAWLSMHGMPNAAPCLSHALGHVLGARFGVPHGVTSCVTQPYVMEFNRPYSFSQQALMAEAAGVDRRGMSEEAAAVQAAWEVDGLITGLGLPHRLRDVGIPQEALPGIAEEAFHEPPMRRNPRPVQSPQELEELLQRAW